MGDILIFLLTIIGNMTLQKYSLECYYQRIVVYGKWIKNEKHTKQNSVHAVGRLIKRRHVSLRFCNSLSYKNFYESNTIFDSHSYEIGFQWRLQRFTSTLVSLSNVRNTCGSNGKGFVFTTLSQALVWRLEERLQDEVFPTFLQVKSNV